MEKKGGERMKDERFVTIEEASKATGVGTDFIRCAIQQGTFPGSYIKNGNRTTFYIPRKAFEDYMTKFHRSPSDELIDCLILAYQNLKKRKSPAATSDS